MNRCWRSARALMQPRCCARSRALARGPPRSSCSADLDDTSGARNLALVAGSSTLDVGKILEALSPQQGMLYYHLLLARLEARGELTHARVARRGEPGQLPPSARDQR